MTVQVHLVTVPGQRGWEMLESHDRVWALPMVQQDNSFVHSIKEHIDYSNILFHPVLQDVLPCKDLKICKTKICGSCELLLMFFMKAPIQ